MLFDAAGEKLMTTALIFGISSYLHMLTKDSSGLGLWDQEVLTNTAEYKPK